MSSVRFESIPPELAGLSHFVLWRKEKRNPIDDGPTKIPYAVDGYRAKSNDPTTWATLATTRSIYLTGGYEGVSFMLAAPYVGIDLDDCRDPQSGVIVPRALRIICSLGTYSEVSPSFAGVKMIVRGSMPTVDGRGKNYRKDPWGNGRGGIEMYQRGRFFTLTGQRLEQTPPTIADGTEALAAMYAELYPPEPRRICRMSRNCDVSIADRLRRAGHYLQKLPSSVAGQGGHNALLHAACTLVRFGLDGAEAIDLLHAYNRRAVPPWDDREIERKLNEARKMVGHEFASFLSREDHQFVRSPRRRRVVFIGGDA